MHLLKSLLTPGYPVLQLYALNFNFSTFENLYEVDCLYSRFYCIGWFFQYHLTVQYKT